MAVNNTEGKICPHAAECAKNYGKYSGEVIANPIATMNNDRYICQYAVIRNMPGCAVTDRLNLALDQKGLLERIVRSLEARR